MKNQINNPKAFPYPMRGADQTIVNQTPYKLDEGMTLRDYFAAKAMPHIQREWWDGRPTDYSEMNTGDADNIAIQSYAIADAMLKERSK